MQENFIQEVDILDEAKENFLTYVSEVLTDRAIPAAEDGLLSAQRKILWTMHDYLKMDADSKTKKSNAVVGATLATSYYHGDASCYGVLCKMAQQYLMRYPLIQGQGSLGTQEDNDIVASSRYTEAKPSTYADLMFNDFAKDVVPTKETYNGEYQEPVVLPSLFPNALCNGRQAIGVSMAHNTPPHNLTEVCNAVIALIQKGDLTLDEILSYIPGPDFPLVNTIINIKDVRNAFATGKSTVSLKIRGEYEIKGKDIIFTSIPYRTFRNKIKEQITKNIEKLSDFIDDFEDESSLMKNKLIFHVKAGVECEKAVEALFAYTDLQTTLSYNMTYIVNGTPKQCSMKDLLVAYVEHQTNVLLKATQYDKDKAEKRAHILRGLVLAIDKIDAVIALIKESSSRAEARTSLIKFLEIDETQANAILDMKLVKLTKLDKEAIAAELKEQEGIIANCIKIIEEKEYRDSVLVNKIEQMKKTFGDARRTKLENKEIAVVKGGKKVVAPEKTVIVVAGDQSVKRVAAAAYKPNPKTVSRYIYPTMTDDWFFVFTNYGRVHKMQVSKLPEGTMTTIGSNFNTICKFNDDEKALGYMCLSQKDGAEYVLLATQQGRTLRVKVEDALHDGPVATRYQIMKFYTDNDRVIDIQLINDDEDLIYCTKQGKSLRVTPDNIPVYKGQSKGVMAVALSENDELRCVVPVRGSELIFVDEKGTGVRMKETNLLRHARNTKGNKSFLTNDLACAITLDLTESFILIGNKKAIACRATAMQEGVLEALMINNKIQGILVK